MNHQNPFVTPAVMVPVEEAMEYARDILAGVDNLLIELSDRLLDGLPEGLTDAQREQLCNSVATRIEAARAAVDEYMT